MIRKLLLLSLLTNICTTLLAQKPVILCGEAYKFKNKFNTINILEPQKNPVGDQFVYLAHIPVDSGAHFSYKLKLGRAQFIIVSYMNERQRLYVYPGDSVHVSFQKIDKPDTINNLILTYYKAFKENNQYSGNDAARIGFFSMLARKTGSLEGPGFMLSKDNANYLQILKTRVTDTYNQRLQLLHDAAQVHHFKPDFVEAAANEIRGIYLDNLLMAVFIGSTPEHDPAYFKEIQEENITWKKLRKSNAYLSFGYSYVMYYNYNPGGVRPSPEARLAAAFVRAANLKDDSVRNFFLTDIISRKMEDQVGNFAELMTRYQQICTNKAYVDGVMAIYQPSVLNKPLPEAVLNAPLMSNNYQLFTLRDVIKKGKPVFIDFWASWCGPCMKEIPILQHYKELYKDQIEFRFVSVDKKGKEVDWLKAIKDKNFLGEHYLIQDDALTNFAQLKTIPRYLIIDKEGKLNTFRGPNLLEDEKGFENALKAVLQ
ncbi:redoxin family protein [Mucilaginibacter robiniae]|uniref:Redoxin family protein n=1 Tax=Mucilaginibacter robiniae TaxID=2728022 RepID=A0A7L5E094_9SPHI|nr:TlpA disulfide reductase family protein [Mucilaginibacter robiniae]QJD96441.1 redoxin family protein [Mucilaginibacter robiniae]